MTIEEHLQKTKTEWKHLIEKVQEYVPVIIGEWSLGLDPQSKSGLTDEEKRRAQEKYFRAQIECFENSLGWFFWNYKVNAEEMKQEWSFQNIKLAECTV